MVRAAIAAISVDDDRAVPLLVKEKLLPPELMVRGRP